MSVVPPQLGCVLNKKSPVMHQGKKPASLFRVRQRPAYTLCLDNGGIPGAGYWRLAFALRLRGPFGAALRAGFHLILLSGP